jgi:hypothetical protein
MSFFTERFRTPRTATRPSRSVGDQHHHRSSRRLTSQDARAALDLAILKLQRGFEFGLRLDEHSNPQSDDTSLRLLACAHQSVTTALPPPSDASGHDSPSRGGGGGYSGTVIIADKPTLKK